MKVDIIERNCKMQKCESYICYLMLILAEYLAYGVRFVPVLRLWYSRVCAEKGR